MKGSMCSIRAWVLLMMNWLTQAMAWDLQHNNQHLKSYTNMFSSHVARNECSPRFLCLLSLQVWGTLVFSEQAHCITTGCDFKCTTVVDVWSVYLVNTLYVCVQMCLLYEHTHKEMIQLYLWVYVPDQNSLYHWKGEGGAKIYSM